MKLRNLVAGLAFIGASAAALAIPTKYVDQYDLGTVSSPLDFIVQNDVSSSSFSDVIKFKVDPSSYATNVLFSQLQLTGSQSINPATTTLSLFDLTDSISFGSVPLNEPAFTAAEILFAGHQYALLVTGTLTAGTSFGTYGISGTLTPVPEPETYALMGLGVVALVAARARRRKLGDDTSFNSVSATAA